MAPPKRKVGGRVTPKKTPGGGLQQRRDTEAPRAAERRPAAPSPRRASDPARRPAPSSRYTPPSKPVRMRPRWQRPAGWIGLALGILVAVVNDVMLINNVTLLPFGHNEAWLFVGLLIAGGSTWFLGLFDRGTTMYR